MRVRGSTARPLAVKLFMAQADVDPQASHCFPTSTARSVRSSSQSISNFPKVRVLGFAQKSPIRSARSRSGSIRTWSSSARAGATGGWNAAPAIAPGRFRTTPSRRWGVLQLLKRAGDDGPVRLPRPHRRGAQVCRLDHHAPRTPEVAPRWLVQPPTPRDPRVTRARAALRGPRCWIGRRPAPVVAPRPLASHRSI